MLRIHIPSREKERGEGETSSSVPTLSKVFGNSNLLAEVSSAPLSISLVFNSEGLINLVYLSLSLSSRLHLRFLPPPLSEMPHTQENLAAEGDSDSSSSDQLAT